MSLVHSGNLVSNPDYTLVESRGRTPYLTDVHLPRVSLVDGGFS